jgi:hypothetical protein
VLQHWASDKLENYRISKLEPVLVEIVNVLKPVVRSFVYNKYGLAFDYTVALNLSHIAERATRVQRLVENDVFIYGRISVRVAVLSAFDDDPLMFHVTSFQVEGITVNVAFMNPTILAIASYLLRDSEHQYHQYIGNDLNVKPLLATTATFCRWALEERRTGRFIASTFVPDANRTHLNRYKLLLDGVSPSQMAALTSLLFTNSFALTGPIPLAG